MKEILRNDEIKFLSYWEEERKKKKSKSDFVFLGIRNASILVSLIFISFLTGWYKRIPLLNAGLLTSMMIGIFLVMVFITVFTVYFNIERNEQRYWELKNKIKD